MSRKILKRTLQPTPKTVAKTDKFGSKIGSQSAQINEVLGDYNWLSVTHIAEDTGLSVSRVRSHMSWLMDRGYVTNNGGQMYQLNLKWSK